MNDEKVAFTRGAKDAPCLRCGHGGYHHRLNDAMNLDPTDPATPFRYVWPIHDP